MINSLALFTVLLAAVYLLALAAVALFKPAHAARFLRGHAASAYLHYVELMLRIAVGLAFVFHSPRMMFGDLFAIFGWIIVGTTAVLFCTPWQWHRRFAQWGVPYAVRNLTLVAICSLALGVSIIICALPGLSNS